MINSTCRSKTNDRRPTQTHPTNHARTAGDPSSHLTPTAAPIQRLSLLAPVHPLGHPRPDRARRDLHDDSLMSDVRRCYIYSEENPMVDFHDVEDHAGEAVHRGFTHIEREVPRERAHRTHVRIWPRFPLRAANHSQGHCVQF